MPRQLFQYEPIYQGAPVEETEKFLQRAANVYDTNMNLTDLIDEKLNQMKVPEGGKEYLNTIKNKVKETIAGIATDATGGKRYDLASEDVRRLAKTFANDQNLTFLQEQRKAIDDLDETFKKEKLAGREPIMFGDKKEEYKPFDENGNQKKFTGYITPMADYQAQINKMINVIQPDEWNVIRNSSIPGFFENETNKTNYKKITNAIDGVVLDYMKTPEGLQEMQVLRDKGVSDEQIKKTLTDTVTRVGTRHMVSSSTTSLQQDPTYLAQVKAAAKTAKSPTGTDVGDMFGDDDREIKNNGTKVSYQKIDSDAFDDSGSLKDSYRKLGTLPTGVPGIPTLPTYNNLSNKKQKELITQLRKDYPDELDTGVINGQKVKLTDKQVWERYEKAHKELETSFRSVSPIKNEAVRKAFTSYGNFEGQLSRRVGFVLGNDAKDTKTLGEQIADKGLTGKLRFEATGMNTIGMPDERINQAGGLVGTVTDEKGNSVEVVLPLSKEQNQHFITVNEAMKEGLAIAKSGKSATDTIGVGKVFNDSSGLVQDRINQYNKTSNEQINIGNAEFRFLPKRYFDKSDGQGLKNKFAYSVQIKLKSGEWKFISSNDPLYKVIGKDWSIDDMKKQSLNSFKGDGVIQNALKGKNQNSNTETE